MLSLILFKFSLIFNGRSVIFGYKILLILKSLFKKLFKYCSSLKLLEFNFFLLLKLLLFILINSLSSLPNLKALVIVPKKSFSYFSSNFSGPKTKGGW